MQMPNIQGHLSEIIGNQKPMGNRRISFQRFKNKNGYNLSLVNSAFISIKSLVIVCCKSDLILVDVMT